MSNDQYNYLKKENYSHCYINYFSMQKLNRLDNSPNKPAASILFPRQLLRKPGPFRTQLCLTEFAPRLRHQSAASENVFLPGGTSTGRRIVLERYRRPFFVGWKTGLEVLRALFPS
jgi:hypothetical protein